MALRARVLIVDDEPMMLRLMGRALQDHETVVTHDAREALAMLAGGERFDVILCDLNMPEMDGMQFHAALTPAQAERTLFVTGGALSPESQQFIQRVGARALAKPVELKQLRAAVAAVLEHVGQ
jgi:CheY-like chemotaxis protein